jgi:hypothetical protein
MLEETYVLHNCSAIKLYTYIISLELQGVPISDEEAEKEGSPDQVDGDGSAPVDEKLKVRVTVIII